MTLKDLRQKRQGRHGAHWPRRRECYDRKRRSRRRIVRQRLQHRCWGSCCHPEPIQWLAVDGEPAEMPRGWGRP